MNTMLSKTQTLIHIVLPQAIRNILPALGNEGIALLKDTSLASVIAISELMHVGRNIASSKFLFMEVFTIVALMYLTTTFILTRLQRLMERRVGGGAGHPSPGRA